MCSILFCFIISLILGWICHTREVMADVAAYEIHELETAEHKLSKSGRRQFLDALIDFTGGIMGE